MISVEENQQELETERVSSLLNTEGLSAKELDIARIISSQDAPTAHLLSPAHAPTVILKSSEAVPKIPKHYERKSVTKYLLELHNDRHVGKPLVVGCSYCEVQREPAPAKKQITLNGNGYRLLRGEKEINYVTASGSHTLGVFPAEDAHYARRAMYHFLRPLEQIDPIYTKPVPKEDAEKYESIRLVMKERLRQRGLKLYAS